MYIDYLKEYEILQRLLKKLPQVDPYTTLVLNVSPDYSSTVSMQIAHHLSQNGKMLDMFSVDVPFPKEDKEIYKVALKSNLKYMPVKYDKIILCEAAVLSGNNYTWIQEVLLDFGYDLEDIITTALLEMESSVFKSQFVGEYIKEMPEFYWERYNSNWE